MKLTEISCLVAELAGALGVQSIKDLPGCWEHQIDDKWWLAANGHQHEIKCSQDALVGPYTMYFTFNGWPMAFITPFQGEIMNNAEDELINALKAAIARKSPPPASPSGPSVQSLLG